MKIVKPQRIALLYKPYEHMGACRLTVTAALYFPFSQPDYLLPEIAMWKMVAKELGKDTPFDLCVPKPRAEPLVVGSAYAPGGRAVERCEVRLSIDGADGPLLDKRLQVTGDRHWTRGVTGLRPSAPVPFTQMPLDWAHAFGGKGCAENPLGKGAAPLPPGPDGGIVHPLPNIEDPALPVTAPDDAPGPAGFGPLDFAWPQRASKAGTYDDKWLRTRFPGFADDLDTSMFNAALPDQWLKKYFRGDESFRVEGMHPEQPAVGGALPGAAMRCLVEQREKDGVYRRDVPMRAETLWLFPHLERAILVFRGDLPVAVDDASDVVSLMIAAESLQDPRPAEYYSQLFDVRLDPKEGPPLMLRDDQLLPPQPARTAPLPDDSGLDDWIYIPRGLQMKRARARMERSFAQGREQLAQARARIVEEQQKLVEVAKRPGLEEHRALLDERLAALAAGIAEIDDGIAKMVLPPEEPPVSLEELPALKNKLVAAGKKAQEEGKVKTAAAEQMARESMARANEEMAKARERLEKVDDPQARAKLAEFPGPLDYDKAKADAVKNAGGPPKPVADPVMAQMKQAEAELKGAAAKIPDSARKAVADDPASDAAKAIKAADEAAAKGLPVDLPRLERQLRDGDARIAALYKQNAHMMMPAQAMDADANARVREAVAAAKAGGKSLAGSDFTGADLSGLDLRGIDLKDALLEAADFSDCDLRGTLLAGAVLARARLHATNLQGADLTGANLGFADLSRANATDARLSGANLANANLSGTDFTGADLTKASLIGCVFPGANFTRAKAPETNFINVDLSMRDELPALDAEPGPTADLDLRGAIFVGTDLHKSNFVNCIVAGNDFSGANLAGAVFLSSKGDGCRFNGAEMTNTRFVLDCSFADCDFTGARIDKVCLRGIPLANGRFDGCSAIQADFTGATLARASFRDALARGARFTKADLTLADLRGINLLDGILQKAVLNGTRLSGANLHGADLLRITVDAGTDFSRANMARTLTGAAEKR